MSVQEVNEKREVGTAEFIGFGVCVLLWYLDKRFQTNVLDGVDIGNISETKAQVLAVAASYKEATEGNPDIIILAGGFMYLLRKAQKMFYTYRNKDFKG